MAPSVPTVSLVPPAFPVSMPVPPPGYSAIPPPPFLRASFNPSQPPPGKFPLKFIICLGLFLLVSVNNLLGILYLSLEPISEVLG